MKLTQIINRTVASGVLFYMICNINPAVAQIPIRDPHMPGYVSATELPDSANASPSANGNFIIGPTYSPASQSMVQANVPHGTIYRFTMDSKDSKIIPALPASQKHLVRRIRQTLPN